MKRESPALASPPTSHHQHLEPPESVIGQVHLDVEVEATGLRLGPASSRYATTPIMIRPDERDQAYTIGNRDCLTIDRHDAKREDGSVRTLDAVHDAGAEGRLARRSRRRSGPAARSSGADASQWLLLRDRAAKRL